MGFELFRIIVDVNTAEGLQNSSYKDRKCFLDLEKKT